MRKPRPRKSLVITGLPGWQWREWRTRLGHHIQLRTASAGMQFSVESVISYEQLKRSKADRENLKHLIRGQLQAEMKRRESR